MQRISRSFAALAAVGLLASTSQAQLLNPSVGTEIGKVEQVQIDSGRHSNLGELAKMVWERKIQRPGASFLQLEFGRHELPKGSWVEITAMKDMDTEVFDSEAIALVNGESSYFNGGELRVRLFAGPLTSDNLVSFKGLGVGKAQAILSPMTICGTVDNRVPSSDKRVARIIMKYSNNSISWCTAWLISPSNTFSTAGHCMANKSSTVTLSTVTAQFNVPSSTSTGSLVNPPSTSQYVWYGSSGSYRRWENGGQGKDWAVFSTQINASTRRHAGEVQGNYFRISTVLPAVNSTLRITGHGTDTTKTRNGIQQTHTGPYKGYTSSVGNRIAYRVDTMGGNSGSAVVKTVGSTEYAIGVHTHGGCTSSSTSTNKGTYTGRSLYASGRSAILNQVLPDLDITAVGTSDSTLYPGQKFTASMIVKNIGKVRVPETSTASFYMSTNNVISTGDSLLGNVSVTTLSVNASQTRTLSVAVPTSYSSFPGTRYLGAYADRTGAVVELSEGNNTAYRAVTILTAAPDLTPTALQASVTTLYPSTKTTMQSRINNTGYATSKSCLSTYYFSTNSVISTSDTALYTFTTTALAANANKLYTYTVTAPSTLPTATCYLGVYVDRNGQNSEVSESNNTRAIAVKCISSGTPDLRVAAMTPSTTSLIGGGTVSLTMGIRNYGNGTTGSSASTGFFLSTNTTISTADYYLGAVTSPSLAPNAQHNYKTTQTIPACPTTGTYYLGAWADFTNRVKESSESNNTRYVAVKLSATRSTLIQWRPYYNTAATNEVAAYISSRAGGTGNMCLIAPTRPGQLYIAVWGGTGSSTSWSFSALSNFSLSLLNGPIFPAWLGTVASNGRAYPRLSLPKGGPAVPTFYAATRVFFFSKGKFAGTTTNSHYVRITK